MYRCQVLHSFIFLSPVTWQKCSPYNVLPINRHWWLVKKKKSYCLWRYYLYTFNICLFAYSLGNPKLRDTTTSWINGDNTQREKRKSKEYDTASFLQGASAVLKHQEEECNDFAFLVAHKLHRMSPHQWKILWFLNS